MRNADDGKGNKRTPDAFIDLEEMYEIAVEYRNILQSST